MIALSLGNTVAAQVSQLTQEIRPIECIYTVITTGDDDTMESSCKDQPVPLVTEVIVNSGRPIVKGSYKTAETRSLKVWINGQWFLKGSDNRLTASNDIWRLDLSQLVNPLAPGFYNVTVEVETYTGFLLVNSDAASFQVKSATVTVPESTPTRPFSFLNRDTPRDSTRFGMLENRQPAISTIMPNTQTALQPKSQNVVAHSALKGVSRNNSIQTLTSVIALIATLLLAYVAAQLNKTYYKSSKP